jgi:hypothetical protein
VKSNFSGAKFFKSKLSHGSALLLVFVISFVLSLAAMRCWHVSSLVCDVQCQRELFYKQFYISDRILNAGIRLACKNFDNFLQLKNPTSIELNSYLTDDETSKFITAQVTVSKMAKMSNCLILSASLICKNETVCNLRCLLERNVDGKANKNVQAVGSYTRSSKSTSFIVFHYTLSASL